MFKFIISFFLFSTFLYGDLAGVRQAMSTYEVKLSGWKKSVMATKTVELKARILADRPDPRKISESLMREIGPELDQASSIAAISWLYKYDPAFLTESTETSPGKVIRSAMKRSHFKFPGAGEVCMLISKNFHPSDMSFLEKVSTQSPSKEDQGLAALAISMALSSLGDEPDLIAKRLENIKRAITLTPTDATVDGQKVMEIIEEQLYLIRNLSKGRKASTFAGVDLGGRRVGWDGKSGKVSVILFWNENSFSQDSIISIFQDTHKLLMELGGEMLGVYTGSRSTLEDLTRERQITWPNIYDQNQEITEQFRMRRTPTMIVLNKEGIIQSISAPNSLVNLTVRALANETE